MDGIEVMYIGKQPGLRYSEQISSLEVENTKLERKLKQARAAIGILVFGIIEVAAVMMYVM